VSSDSWKDSAKGLRKARGAGERKNRETAKGRRESSPKKE